VPVSDGATGKSVEASVMDVESRWAKRGGGGTVDETAKPSIETQGVEVPPRQSRSGPAGNEHCRLPGDRQASKRMQ
jgi:hypothetical protein